MDGGLGRSRRINATPVVAQPQASFEYEDANGARQVLGPTVDAGRMRYDEFSSV